MKPSKLTLITLSITLFGGLLQGQSAMGTNTASSPRGRIIEYKASFETDSGYDDNVFDSVDKLLLPDNTYSDVRQSSGYSNVVLKVGRTTKWGYTRKFSVFAKLAIDKYYSSALLDAQEYSGGVKYQVRLLRKLTWGIEAGVDQENQQAANIEGIVLKAPLNNLTVSGSSFIRFKPNKQIRWVTSVDYLISDYEEVIGVVSLDQTKLETASKISYKTDRLKLSLDGDYVIQSYLNKAARDKAGVKQSDANLLATTSRQKNNFGIAAKLDYLLGSTVNISLGLNLDSRVDPFEGYYSYSAQKYSLGFDHISLMDGMILISGDFSYKTLGYDIKTVSDGTPLEKVFTKVGFEVGVPITSQIYIAGLVEKKIRTTNEPDESRTIFRGYDILVASVALKWAL